MLIRAFTVSMFSVTHHPGKTSLSAQELASYPALRCTGGSEEEINRDFSTESAEVQQAHPKAAFF